MLGAVADVQETRATAAGPGHPQTAVTLARALAEMLGWVRGATDVPPPLRDQIETDLLHAIWLLTKVDTFGVDHAVAAVERLAGKVTTAAAKARSPRLKKVAVGLAAALTFASGASTSVEAIVQDVQSVFGTLTGAGESDVGNVVTSAVIEVYNVCDPKALEAGSTVDADLEDAEIIDGEGRAG